jgi:hypothetical protein
MKVYIITRFSIFDPTSTSYRLTRNSKSVEQYKKVLFSKQRLSYKFTVFETITLPSIVQQTYKNFEWHIYTSSYLPEFYKKRLLYITKQFPYIKVFFIESFSQFNTITFQDNYCTIRLDDDDGLYPTFFELLQQYKNITNSIISFPKGRKCSIIQNKIVYGKPFIYKKIAAGLCAINMNIYNCGNHDLLNKKYKVLYNMKPNMYLLHCSIHCDTKRML